MAQATLRDSATATVTVTIPSGQSQIAAAVGLAATWEQSGAEVRAYLIANAAAWEPVSA